MRLSFLLSSYIYSQSTGIDKLVERQTIKSCHLRPPNCVALDGILTSNKIIPPLNIVSQRFRPT